MREFLDLVVVPALLKKYLAELEEVKPAEKTACACELPSGILVPVRSPRSARGGTIE
jgi:hypothetical protein